MRHYEGKHSPKRPERPEGRWKAFYCRHKIPVLAIGGVAVVLAAAAAAAGIWWKTLARPEVPSLPAQGGSTLGSLVEGVEIDEEMPGYLSDQKEGVYTFLFLGRTNDTNQTDMMMLIVFDANTGEVNACSIPRDTMINISADAKKINSVIFDGVDNVKNWVRKTLGVYPNFYVMLDWQAVGELVDAVGGVYYDVPCRMYYVDSTPGAGFKIDLEPGYQLLDGDKAMQLIRWRKNAPGYTEYAREAGFDGSNTKRTEMQQDFMVAAAKQVLQLKNVGYLGSMVQVFREHVETDLSLSNMAWFARTALEQGSVNKVTFHTLPANANGSAFSRANTRTSGKVSYLSFVTFDQQALVKLVNEYLNPYNQEISLSDLDLMHINADGTISSSTGYTADTLNNAIIPYLADLRSGAAYLDSSYNVVYYETEDMETPPADGENPTGEEPGGGEMTDGEEEPSIGEETPQEPGVEELPPEETVTQPGEEAAVQQETPPNEGTATEETQLEGGTI